MPSLQVKQAVSKPKKTTGKNSNAKTKATKNSPKKGKTGGSKKNLGKKNFFKRIITRNFLITCAKIVFTFICVFSFYIGYLDHKVRTKMNGQIWQLPVEVYSKIHQIRTHSHDFEQIIQLLKQHNYRQTYQLALAGDFIIEGQNIKLINRAFSFPKKNKIGGSELIKSPESVILLKFSQQKLTEIIDLATKQRLQQIYLKPILIDVLDGSNENRIVQKLQNYPRFLIDILLLSEDQSFYTHHGVNLTAILRAIITNFRAGRTVQGASTITQQLAKNLFLSPTRSLTRKVNELFISLILEARYSKNQILQTYLNEVYLGQNKNEEIHGFALASLFYFNQPINEISLDKIALLVGMVKGASLYNPKRNPQNATKRRNVVLALMKKHNILNQELYQTLSSRDLGLKQGAITKNYPAFISHLRHELQHKLSPDELKKLAGGKVFSSMDLSLQKNIDSGFKAAVTAIEKSKKSENLEGAMVVVDYKNGGVLAEIGSKNTQYQGYNRALLAQRQIGSLIKPAIYLSALQTGKYQLNSRLNNVNLTVRMKGAPIWRPHNFDHSQSAPVMLKDALARSLNIPTVNLGLSLGLDYLQQQLNLFGLDFTNIRPSDLLGSKAFSPVKISQIYQLIANQGQAHNITTIDGILDNKGKIVQLQPTQTYSFKQPQPFNLTLFALQQVAKTGTAKKLAKIYPHLNLAAKTGTSNDGVDSWVSVIDGDKLTTIWLGQDDNKPTKLTGSSGALAVFLQLSHNLKLTPLKINYADNIQFIGLNSNGDFSCSSTNKIPAWNLGKTCN